MQLSEKEFVLVKEELISRGWDETGFTWEHGIAYYHGIPLEEEVKRRSEEQKKYFAKLAAEQELADQWNDTRFAQSFRELSLHFPIGTDWNVRLLIDAFNQICDILRMKETVGGKSNPSVAIESLPASATKQELLQALLKADEALTPVYDAMSACYEDENCTEPDRAMNSTYFMIQAFLLQIKLNALQQP